MKEAVIRAVNTSVVASGKGMNSGKPEGKVTSGKEVGMIKLGGRASKRKGKVIGFQWGKAQQEVFEEVKRAIRENVIVGGDPNRRYYVTNTATTHGFASVLFQLTEVDEEKLEAGMETERSRFPRGKDKVVQFISQTFTDMESRYTDIERRYLAIIRTLEEIRYLVFQSQFPVIVYTSPVVVGLLNNNPDEPKGNRITWWQTRMGDFRIIPRSLKGKDLSASLACVTTGVPEPWTTNKE